MKEQLESVLRYLDDDGTITQACIEYGQKTNSSAAIVGLLRVRELINIVLQPAVEADAKCSADFHKEEYLNGSTFCRVCGKRIRTA